MRGDLVLATVRGRRTEAERSGPMRAAVLLAVCALLAGCGAVALPFKVTADVVRVVPVAGDIVAAPIDAAAEVID